MYPTMPLNHEGRTLPIITLRQIDLPEVKTWDVNGEYYLIAKVKMIGKHDQMESDQKVDINKVEGDFQITSVRALGKEPLDLKSIEQKDWENTISAAMQGKL